MNAIKNIIFDFDGTLANTSKLIVATMQKSIQDCGFPYRTEEQIKSTIGVRLEEIPSILWPSYKNIGKNFAATYRHNFETLKDKTPISLFPGVIETLSLLKEEGYQMAIATSRSHRSVEELTEKLEIRDFFIYILGGDDVLEGKPNPESIYKIMADMEWKNLETLMVGDMPVDILMGKYAGIRTCGVTYGNGKAIEMEEVRPDLIIDSFKELSETFATR